MSKFESLKVWDNSLYFIKEIYQLCLKLPSNEKSNLIDQIKRAAVSISLNIAEGAEGRNDKEFRRYLIIARKSLSEVIACLRIIKYLYSINIDHVEMKAVELAKMLNGLIKFLYTHTEV